MKILIDMNLSPGWAELLARAGHSAVHWSFVGRPSAPDEELMAWAAGRGHVVLTQDLDFSAILAATKGIAPSVIQVRAQNTLPRVMGAKVIGVLSQFEQALLRGAIVVVDDARSRVRMLPLGR